MLRIRLFFPSLIVLAALAAACGGGGSSSPLPASPTATPTPHAGPTSVPVGPTQQAVVLSGGGYTLQFKLPPVLTGSATTMSAVLQTTLPSGTIAPQVARRGYTRPQALPTAYTGLVYLVTSTTDTVGFSYAPGFEYTLPAGTTIPSGSYAYLLYWDPYVSGTTGWIPLLGPGTVAGQTVSFSSVQTGVQFDADTPYVFALAEASQPHPTASPAPTPTPASTALPAYCANFSTAQPNAISSPQPVYFTDNSGTGAQVYLYVVEGAPAHSTQTQYLGTDGQLHDFMQGVSAPAIPLECFPGSTHHGSGKTFALPPPTSTGYGASLYIAYATPNPGDSTPPNPLTFAGTSNGGNTQPTYDWNTPATYASAPFDFVEFTLPHGVTDITQVDKVGLPLLVEQNDTVNPQYGDVKIGFQSAATYQNLLSGITGDPIYKSLAVSTVLNGRSVLARILSPEHGEDWGFPQDWWYNSAYNSAYSSASGKGYVGYVLSKYQAAPQLYTVNGIAGFSGNYCATSDGVSNVLFYSVGSATTCSGLSGSPAYTMPIASTLEGTGTTDSYGVCGSALFQMPYGGPTSGSAIPDLTSFYLWKAMAIDLNRGVALQQGPHPIDGWNTNPSPIPPIGDFYKDHVSNTYAHLVHQNMIGNRSYALQYDEPGGLAPTLTSDPAVPLQITIWNIPAYSRTTPTTTASPIPCPT